MKLGRILAHGPDGDEARLVAVDVPRGVVVDLAGAERRRLTRGGAAPEAALRLARALFPGSMAQAIALGDAFLPAARRALEDADPAAVLPLGDVTWLAPLDPPSLRDFMSFEEHFVTAYGRIGRPVPPVLYEQPVYYKGAVATIIGPGATVPWPAGSAHLDYELELGLVVGREARDLAPDEAGALLFGVTALDDFSARDLQAREMTGGLGPAKGKDFATAIGPWITTVDELPGLDLEMVARVNGEVWSRKRSGTALFRPDELIAQASRSERLLPGDLLGTGTVGGGCGLELGRRLAPGDLVELEIEGVGVLANRIGAPGPAPLPLPPRR
jgi:2-keto-4-pentenoate hydratase/2-oxohepta-3-ene-1,7-dioic acid hydratase in catechol pathway